ncbi:MAG: sigma 54-interacting transcriptional regulator [Syntrophobacteraceae bacterium]
MDSVCEVKLNIFSALHRVLDRALHCEQSLEGVVGALSQAVPHTGAAVVVRCDAEVRFFFSRCAEDTGNGLEQRVRTLYKKDMGILFRLPQPFVLPGDATEPLFLDRKTLHTIRKEQVGLFGAPILQAGEVAGAILVDRFFDDRTPILEEVQVLSLLASFIDRLLGLQARVRRREEALVRENRALRARVSEEGLELVCFGRSEAAKKLETQIRGAANADAPVHISGEPGTGKSLAARLIHELSERRRFPFVRVHCALPEEVLEKELFGHTDDFLQAGMTEPPGALPPARPQGAFERAAGGTLLLDEVGDLSPAHQVRLLDTLDGLWNEGLGAEGATTRIVSVSGADLLTAHTHAFRKDLFGRLGTLRIHIPPVRDRKEDIPGLIEHFLSCERRKEGRKTQMSPRALEKLCEHDWPGNIAEIRNTVIRLVVMAGGEQIEAGEVESVLRGAVPASGAQERVTPLSSWSRLDKIEIREVSAALERNSWVRRKAADELGLTFRQMNYRVKKYGLDTLIKENKGKK